MLAIEISMRTKTYDTASWASIMESGLLIEDQCVAPTDGQGGLRIPLGGNVLTGQLDRNLLGSYHRHMSDHADVILSCAGGE